MSADKKLERPLFIDMDFGEALRRFAQTKPEEVEPALGQRKKAVRHKPKPKSDDRSQVREDDEGAA